jgi:hypothetical protein
VFRVYCLEGVQSVLPWRCSECTALKVFRLYCPEGVQIVLPWRCSDCTALKVFLCNGCNYWKFKRLQSESFPISHVIWRRYSWNYEIRVLCHGGCYGCVLRDTTPCSVLDVGSCSLFQSGRNDSGWFEIADLRALASASRIDVWEPMLRRLPS